MMGLGPLSLFIDFIHLGMVDTCSQIGDRPIKLCPYPPLCLTEFKQEHTRTILAGGHRKRRLRRPKSFLLHAFMLLC